LGERLSDSELENIDLVLLDIKGWDSETHRHLTGAAIDPVLKFASRLAAQKRPVWLRFVLVPGLSDDAEAIDSLASFAARLENIQRVDILPFHQMGRFKWAKLQLSYSLNDVVPPSADLVERVRQQFLNKGLKAY